VADRRCCHDATPATGWHNSRRYGGAWPCRQLNTIMPSLYTTCSGTSNQRTSVWRSPLSHVGGHLSAFWPTFYVLNQPTWTISYHILWDNDLHIQTAKHNKAGNNVWWLTLLFQMIQKWSPTWQRHRHVLLEDAAEWTGKTVHKLCSA